MAKLNLSIAINLLTQGVSRGAQQVQNTFKKLKSSITSTLGNLGIGLGLGSFFTSMVNAGRSFEDAMARVKAVSNAASSDFKKMRDEAIKMGANTKYSATEAANALENLTRNGLSAADATAALSKNLEFAQANSIDLAMGADILTNTMNEFGLKVSDLGKISDTLSSTAAHSATNVELLGEALTNAAPLAQNCGIGIQETNAALGTLANVGIKGADAGTALRQFFLGLSHDTPQGAKALAKYGLAINQTTLQADGLQKTLEKMSKSGIGRDNNALSDVFGSRAFAGAASLINNYDKFVSINKTLGASSGETSRMFGQSTGKMENNIKSLESAWEHFQIMFFDSSEGLFTAPVEGLTSFVRFAANNLSALAQTIVAVFAGVHLRKWFGQLKVQAASAAATSVKSMKAAHMKVIALQKERLRIEKQMSSLSAEITKASGDEKVYYETLYQQKKKELEANGLATQRAAAAESVAIQRAAQVQSLTGWRATWANMKAGFASLGNAIKGVFASIKWMVVIEAVMQIVQGIGSIVKQWRGATGIVKDYNTEIAKSTHNEEITQLEQIQRRLNENKRNQKAIPNIIAEANKALGTSYSRYQDVNNALREKIKLLKQAAQIEGVQHAISDLEQSNAEILARQGVGSGAELTQKLQKIYPHGKNGFNFNKEAFGDTFKYFFGRMTGQHSMYTDSGLYKENSKAIGLLQKQLDGLITKQANSTPHGEAPAHTATATPSAGVGNTGNTKSDRSAEEYEQTVNSYNEQLRKLKAQQAAGYITTSEYLQNLRDLNRETAIDIATSKNAKLKQSAFAEGIAKAVKEEPSNSLIKFNQITEELSQKEKAFQTGLDNGVESADTLTDGLREAYLSAIRAASSLDGLTDSQKGMVNGWRTQLALLQTPDVTAGRDKTFDYKRTKKEKLKLDLDDAKAQLQELEEKAKDSFGALDAEIERLRKKKVSLSDALKLEELREDVSRLKRESFDNLFTPLQDADSIKDSIQNLIDVINSPNTDGWEKLISVFETLKNVVDGLLDTVDSIKKIQEVFSELKSAKEEEAAADTTTTNQEVANAAKKSAAATASSATTSAAAAGEVAANTADAASSAAAGAAKLPFPANLIAIAGAITAVFGIMASLKHFAGGGIVQGQPFDRSLAAVSDGEMILNGSQQNNLWRAIKNGNFGGGASNVTFRIRGRDLEGVLRNQNNKMSKI